MFVQAWIFEYRPFTNYTLGNQSCYPICTTTHATGMDPDTDRQYYKAANEINLYMALTTCIC